MDILTAKSTSENVAPPASHGDLCQVCIDEPIAGEDMKARLLLLVSKGSALPTNVQQNKMYPSNAKLQKHLVSRFHAQFSRPKHEIKAPREADAHRLYRSKYCPATGKAHANIKALLWHIHKSTAINAGRGHDAAKAADGWYDEGVQTEEELPGIKEPVVITGPVPTGPLLIEKAFHPLTTTTTLSTFAESLPSRPYNPLAITDDNKDVEDERKRHDLATNMAKPRARWQTPEDGSLSLADRVFYKNATIMMQKIMQLQESMQ